MALTSQEILTEMHRLIEAGNARDIQIRAIGGLAVQAHNKTNHPLFTREFADLDFVVARKQRREFETFMPEVGYSPDKQFNVLNGATRQIYFDDKTDMKMDIFIGDFEMCHKIPLEERLTADPVTIPLAELLLSKAQIVELNRKDLLDITSILLNNETGRDDNEKINLQILVRLCSQDWGLYKTTSINLQRVEDLVGEAGLPLADEERALVIRRVREIQHAFETMEKPIAWQLRDRVGTRVKWYIEVEEVDR
ncbi:MAG: nucleotidyltransferase family protein [Anaerolineales bacterium]|nr:MAG: nucleotidyltransferase family protein [Anaerolineales bacterium]